MSSTSPALAGFAADARRSLVAGSLRTTANTNIVHMFGKLLALKEDALPYEMDPHTLRTIGIHNFDGQYTCPTFTAHPKVDPVSGEVITCALLMFLCSV